MAQLHLPAAHSDSDLILAGLVAERVDSAELFVAWTPDGPATPEVTAELRAPAPHWSESVALLLHALRDLFGVRGESGA